MSGRYATQTEVPVGKTRGEIEDLLVKYGASKFMYATDSSEAVVGFSIGGRVVKITLPLPSPDEPCFTQTEHRYPRPKTASAARAAYEQAVRTRWRALHLVLKAKLEAVEIGISTIEREFLADTVIGRETVYEALRPQLEAIYRGEQRPELPCFERKAISA